MLVEAIFVDADEPGRIEVEIELALEPCLPTRQDARTILLLGVNTPFLTSGHAR